MKADTFRKIKWLHLAVLAAQINPFSPTADIHAASPTLKGCPLFPANNIWNTPVDTLPVAALSSQYIVSMGAKTTSPP